MTARPVDGSSASRPGAVQLDVVICTYNNAALLDRTLAHLADQTADPARWRVLVVDNNSSDETAERLERHRLRGRVPGLRYVLERTQGKVPAMHRGIGETSAPWVAFVDDDCLLEPDWVTEALAFAAANRDCGGFGGRVEPWFENAPPAGVATYGVLFAKQDYSDGPREVASLVGAGMVVQRRALEESGWLSNPLLEDRVGTNLGACGDLEIALRVRATGYQLWFVPTCRLSHVIPPSRVVPRHLTGLASGLGTGAIMTEAMTGPPTLVGGLRTVVSRASFHSIRALRRSVGAVLRRRSLLCARLDRRFAAGAWIGVWRLLRLPVVDRSALMGAANRLPAFRWDLSGYIRTSAR